MPFQSNSGTLPATWGSWTQLRRLSLGPGGFSGPLPQEWGGWPPLESLRLSGLGVTGGLPPGWFGNTTNTTASANTTANTTASANTTVSTNATVSGQKELELTNMPGLQVSWPALQALTMRGAPSLRHVALGGLGNMTASGLSPFLGSFSSLETLVLANMSTGGTVPAAWASLPAGRLSTLDLSGNALSGTLPSWLMALVGPPPAMPFDAAMRKGWLLDLSRNILTGAARAGLAVCGAAAGPLERGVWTRALLCPGPLSCL
jgi:hypothetical protein